MKLLVLTMKFLVACETNINNDMKCINIESNNEIFDNNIEFNKYNNDNEEFNNTNLDSNNYIIIILQNVFHSCFLFFF